jgi:hypothetical protein
VNEWGTKKRCGGALIVGHCNDVIVLYLTPDPCSMQLVEFDQGNTAKEKDP